MERKKKPKTFSEAKRMGDVRRSSDRKDVAVAAALLRAAVALATWADARLLVADKLEHPSGKQTRAALRSLRVALATTEQLERRLP